ncbi:hypothetical protein CGCF415_v009909 [Colletotrichum fructicola]|uniref:Uncharacterized protein n=2 Tax=Colletotrichum gloeosporioides species complex TaxID=2707338 RepID=L2FJX1_COLFN|nr:uncharacterized protein CGMCC3_g2597 [Colletotrichum fructicola]XP_053041554.1 uncharacterized protein COL26b_001677 [Colletotrichum chrysophilum]KAF4476270.1 hypothetical protein CGGC5_v014545 [Colletotrichum fructicola Nara gc5]KAE9581516.1 hypothetical protein CGMCC3_g2597 [Colletotrichum fructicola]KAF4433180.1 hypothetical protein CFRS1_v010503 [Colletotrichum fructicola]KAF4887853.1 hypothetical protein CGCFRS4_v010295 [Colletotrichum fructicola]KAF4900977.1 hypothetical protein CGCF
MSAEGDYTQLSNVANDDDIDAEYVKIYMMIKLTEEEEQKYLKSIDGTVGQDEGSWVHPKLVPWTSDTDGIPDKDLLEYYKGIKEEEGSESEFYGFFADRKSVEEGGTILVDRAWYALCTSKKASEQISELARDNGIEMTAKDWMSMPGYAEDLMDLALERGIVWGREAGAQWKSDWMNLDVSNMDTGELLEDKFEILLDLEWNSAPFLERLREELEKTRDHGES